MKTLRNPTGFTLAELMISVTVLALMITFATSVYVNFFGSMRNVRAANLVYEEARFAMERMVKEVRNGTIDYEEYFNQDTHFFGGLNETYGQNYCEYSRQFYGAGKDEFFGTTDDESTGERNEDATPAIPNAIANNLFLININGTQRTYIKRFEQEINGRTIGRIGILGLEGRDYGIDHLSPEAEPPYSSNCLSDEGEKDGRIDTWFCADGFDCGGQTVTGEEGCTGTLPVIADTDYVAITPASLDVTDLRFILTPADDPRKAYNDASVQIQPQVTLRLTARANASLTNEFRLNSTPSIVLASSVSARVYNEIITECNLRECLTGQLPKVCPKTLGVCAPATQQCSQGVWPGCSAEDYSAVAGVGADGLTLYENSSETGSCLNDNDCKRLRCTDGADNDCNGLKDTVAGLEDPACLLYLCDNSVQDTGEECLNVGGICHFIRPKTTQENNDALCFDGYDNDCNGTADELDANCVQFICTDQILNPPLDEAGSRVAPLFAPALYTPANYLLAPGASDAKSTLNEICPDVGGLCSTLPGHLRVPLGGETGDLCDDGLDNDCNGTADELDGNCVTTLCSNQQLDCGLVNRDFTPANMLSGYEDPLCNPLLLTDLDEGLGRECVDVGGLCGEPTPENTVALCDDGKDNDCNGQKDGDPQDNADSGCCPDDDVDGFSAFGATCRPARADALPTNGAIDCNNLSTSVYPDAALIYPGAPEVCNDAVYPAGNPIDNNCSFANGVTPASAWDHDDPRCCVDADGDGYGDSSAYIYFDNNVQSPAGTVLCGFSGAAHSLGTESPDCDESDPAVNPGAAELGAACTDGKDNDCNSLTDALDPGCAPPMPPEPPMP